MRYVDPFQISSAYIQVMLHPPRRGHTHPSIYVEANTSVEGAIVPPSCSGYCRFDISPDAVSGLDFSPRLLTFWGRFGGSKSKVTLPLTAITRIHGPDAGPSYDFTWDQNDLPPGQPHLSIVPTK